MKEKREEGKRKEITMASIHVTLQLRKLPPQWLRKQKNLQPLQLRKKAEPVQILQLIKVDSHRFYSLENSICI